MGPVHEGPDPHSGHFVKDTGQADRCPSPVLPSLPGFVRGTGDPTVFPKMETAQGESHRAGHMARRVASGHPRLQTGHCVA